jgi:hypothetical protein
MATKITGTVSGEPIIEYEVGGVFVPWKQGIQNWATVTAVTGSPASGSYTDADGVEWTYYKWTSSGSVTVTAGNIDALIVGGGGGCGPNGTSSGGRINYGILSLTSDTHTVTVGAGGAASNYASGRWSGLGPHIVGDIKGLNGSGSGEVGGGSSTDFGISSSITGSSVNYGVKDATGNLVANTGSTSVSLSVAGTAGVVIIRVPSTFAQA